MKYIYKNNITDVNNPFNVEQLTKKMMETKIVNNCQELKKMLATFKYFYVIPRDGTIYRVAKAEIRSSMRMGFVSFPFEVIVFRSFDCVYIQ